MLNVAFFIVMLRLFMLNDAMLSVQTPYKGLYYKTLRIRNLRENVRFRNKLVTLARTNTLLLEQTNTLAYYGVSRLRISNFLQYRPL
jgi:hypothetical protein